MLFREWQTPEASSIVAIESAVVTVETVSNGVEDSSRKTLVDRDMQALNLAEY